MTVKLSSPLRKVVRANVKNERNIHSTSCNMQEILHGYCNVKEGDHFRFIIIPNIPCISAETNRIYHRSSMQTEKSQPEGKRIMPETRFTDFPALSVDPRIGISWSTSETND